jgi:hypothetical protein
MDSTSKWVLCFWGLFLSQERLRRQSKQISVVQSQSTAAAAEPTAAKSATAKSATAKPTAAKSAAAKSAAAGSKRKTYCVDDELAQICV